MDSNVAKWELQVSLLRDLQHQAGWDTYQEFLQAVTTEHIEALLASPSGSIMDYLKGYVAGLRRAAQIPAEVLKNSGQAKGNS